MKPRPGVPYPLGATYDGAGVNFALFSENATGVELCLFGNADGNDETARFQLAEQTDQAWHIYLPGIGPASVTATVCTGRTNLQTEVALTRQSC